MKTDTLTEWQRRLRGNVRNFLCAATREELRKELDVSLRLPVSEGAAFRAECVRELIAEMDEDEAQHREQRDAEIRAGC